MNKVFFRIVSFLLVLSALYGCSGSVSWTYFLPEADVYITLQYPRNEDHRCYVIFSRDSTINEISDNVDYLKIISSEYTIMSIYMKPDSDTVIVRGNGRVCEYNDSNVFSFDFLDLQKSVQDYFVSDSIEDLQSDGYQTIILDEYYLSYDHGKEGLTELCPLCRQVVGKKKGKKHYYR